MKKLLLIITVFSFLVSCGGAKQTEKALYSGNYNEAISNALRKLESNKNKKRKQAFIAMLEDAYYKATERDLNRINHLKKDGNPEHYKAIYDLYENLDARQEAIKPVLPLRINGKSISFQFNDYINSIIEYRANVSSYMYGKALVQLNNSNKHIVREAYKTLSYIESINPNYKDVRQLIDVAHQKGTDYVLVTVENKTNQIIPKPLEDDLLNFDAYGINQFWTTYHANSVENLEYDYKMQLQLVQINISPEQIRERQLLRKKQIIDGWEYKLDRNGNVAKDSLGNDIKIDKIIDVRARYFEFQQIKSTQIIAEVVYTDLKSNQLLESFPIDSEFVFENYYATIRGDKRALDKDEKDLLKNRQIHFPTNEQMIFDTGEDLKLKLKDILSSYQLGS